MLGLIALALIRIKLKFHGIFIIPFIDVSATLLFAERPKEVQVLCL